MGLSDQTARCYAIMPTGIQTRNTKESLSTETQASSKSTRPMFWYFSYSETPIETIINAFDFQQIHIAVTSVSVTLLATTQILGA